jgi:hypothetical protein
MDLRISKAALLRSWIWTTGLGLAIFVVLAALDLKLKALSGVGTFDLQSLTNAAQFRAAFWAWSAGPNAARAGFNLGFDYLLMPLYAASFYFSGIILGEAARGQLRRLVLLAAIVPLAGALCDAVENGLQLWMFWNGPTDALAQLAAEASTAKYAALIVGAVLWIGAVLAMLDQRRRRRLAARE